MNCLHKKSKYNNNMKNNNITIIICGYITY